MSAISPLASVDPGAVIGDDVTIGPFTVVHADVEIGAGANVSSHCVLGERGPGDGGPLRLGPGAVIRSHTVVYAGSTFGPRLETGHRVTLREGLQVGENLRAGTLCDLQGDATIGDYTRLHSNVHVGKHTTIGNYVWVFPYTVFTNDPHPPSTTQIGCVIEDFAVIGTMVVVLPGVRVGREAVVSAGAVVTRDVEPGQLAMGSPAKPKRPASEIPLSDGSGPAYPWRRHYDVGYPDALVARWRDELGA
jgi:acetyltransferase-like isoleucine patch superfamily enzyme